jgi:hypothetical protein
MKAPWFIVFLLFTLSLRLHAAPPEKDPIGMWIPVAASKEMGLDRARALLLRDYLEAISEQSRPLGMTAPSSSWLVGLQFASECVVIRK